MSNYIISLFGSSPFSCRLTLYVLIPFCLTLIGYFIKKYLRASEEFRNTVYTKLEGVYPNIVYYMSDSDRDNRIQTSITPINTAGKIFRHYLPSFSVRFFDSALGQYCDTARKTDWNEQMARQMFPNTHFNGPDPKDELYKAVDNLLKFAK